MGISLPSRGSENEKINTDVNNPKARPLDNKVNL